MMAGADRGARSKNEINCPPQTRAPTQTFETYYTISEFGSTIMARPLSSATPCAGGLNHLSKMMVGELGKWTQTQRYRPTLKPLGKNKHDVVQKRTIIASKLLNVFCLGQARVPLEFSCSNVREVAAVPQIKAVAQATLEQRCE